MVTWKTRIDKSSDKRSLIPWGLRLPIWKTNFCSKRYGFLCYHDVEECYRLPCPCENGWAG